MDWIKDFLRPELIWFVVGIALLLFEFVLPGFIIAFFGAGAIVTAIVCMVTDISINWQLVIFIASSVVLLAGLRKWVKGIFVGHSAAAQDITEEMRDFVGERAKVVEKIVPKIGGKVELHGVNWNADAEEQIDQDEIVEVVRKDNLTLIVKRL